MVCLVYFHRWIAVKEKIVNSVKSFKKSNVGILSIFVGAGVFAIGFSYSLPFLMILAMPIFWYADNKLTQPVNTLQAMSELMLKLLEESEAQPRQKHREVAFKYKGKDILPYLAYYKDDGSAFTGMTGGTVDYIDWSGYFEDGKPHGEFSLVFGDRYRQSIIFEHGVEVPKKKSNNA
jgi:predicted nucleic acid-binding Zn ribbon protein